MAGPSAGGHRQSGPRTAATRRSGDDHHRNSEIVVVTANTTTTNSSAAAAAYQPRATAVTGAGVNSVVTNEPRAAVGGGQRVGGRAGQSSWAGTNPCNSGWSETLTTAPSDYDDVVTQPRSIGSRSSASVVEERRRSDSRIASERNDASRFAPDVICVTATADGDDSLAVGHRDADPSVPQQGDGNGDAVLECSRDVIIRDTVDSSESRDDVGQSDEEEDEIMDVCDYASEQQIAYDNIDRIDERIDRDNNAATTGTSDSCYLRARPVNADEDQSSSTGNHVHGWTIERHDVVSFGQGDGGGQRPAGVASIRRHQFHNEASSSDSGVAVALNAAAAAASAVPLRDAVAATAASSISTSSAGAPPSTNKVVWRRREQQESASTEGSLRAMLNKLAPSQNSFDSLATQVAGHLLEDEAPEELARQLVDRAQLEPMYAATYARLCSVLVRVRSGFVFYKHLMTRCQTTFTQGVRSLIVEPMETCDVNNSDRWTMDGNIAASSTCSGTRLTNQLSAPRQEQHGQLYAVAAQHYSQPIQQQQQLRPQQHRQHSQQIAQHQLAVPTNSNGSLSYTANPMVSSGSSSGHGHNSASENSSSSTNAGGSNSNSYPTDADMQRHRLKALVVFLCHLFIESQLTFDRLHDEYLKLLEVHLPGDDVAIECICSALSCAGRAIEGARPQWVAGIVRQLQSTLRSLHTQRKLRMIFMVQDVVDLQQRNWQQREPSALTSASRMPRDQAEP